MVHIRPIKGVRFINDGSLDYSKLITPPYDVINDEMQEAFYQESPYNIIRLEFGKSLPGDGPGESKYTRAAETLSHWIQNEIIIQEEKPALYLYEQHFQIEKELFVRESIFCGVQLSPFEEGKIIPHEETMSKPKADRLELLRHCETNFSPIFALYKDEDYFLEKRFKHIKNHQRPSIDFTDADGQQHRIWILSDERDIKALQHFFENKSLFIADGHHRYETALHFFQEKKAQRGDASGYDHVLMALVNIYNSGLLVYPTHRLLTRSPLETKELLQKLSGEFDIHKFPEPATRDDLMSWLRSHQTSAVDKNLVFGLYTPEKSLYKIVVKSHVQETKKPYPWLDTVVLQELIFSNVFGLGDKERKDDPVLVYVKDEWEAKRKVDKGEAAYLFFVNTPPVEEIIYYAEKGIRMPQKSTYFFPKFVTGLIMLKLGDEAPDNG